MSQFCSSSLSQGSRQETKHSEFCVSFGTLGYIWKSPCLERSTLLLDQKCKWDGGWGTEYDSNKNLCLSLWSGFYIWDTFTGRPWGSASLAPFSWLLRGLNSWGLFFFFWSIRDLYVMGVCWQLLGTDFSLLLWWNLDSFLAVICMVFYDVISGSIRYFYKATRTANSQALLKFIVWSKWYCCK